MKLTDLALVFGATVRLSRFVTTDSLGDWYIVQPAKRWATNRDGGDFEGSIVSPSQAQDLNGKVEDPVEPVAGLGNRSKLVSGLECPACVGFWIGAGVVGSYVIAQRDPRLLRAWRIGAGIFGLNYVVYHVSSRID